MKRVFKLLICIIPVFLIVGCTNKKVTKEIKPEKMEQFIIQKTEDDKIENYSIKNDKYEKITDNNVKDKYLLYYNEKYNTAEYNDGGNILIQKGNESIKLPDNTEFMKIDDKCSMVFYKTSDGENYSYNILNIDDNKKSSIDISLSGNCIDWKNSSTLVFYGIIDNEAALYYYDINNGNIKMASKVENGFVNYLDVLGDNIYYLVNFFDGSSSLKDLDANGETSLDIDVPYKNMFDMKRDDNTVYILAGDSEKVDLYYILDGEIEKANYDFPRSIKIDSFLYFKDKSVYFIGLDEEDNEGLYVFSAKENEVKLLCIAEGKNHISINN